MTTTNGMTLFDQVEQEVESLDDDKPIQEAFEAFHQQHPEVFRLFREYALQVRAAGHERFGSKAIVEQIRWHFAINQGHDGGFKINNNFTSRYARLLEQRDPRFKGFFRNRVLKSEEQQEG